MGRQTTPLESNPLKKKISVSVFSRRTKSDEEEEMRNHADESGLGQCCHQQSTLSASRHESEHTDEGEKDGTDEPRPQAFRNVM